jgi:hypothetical protein
MKNHLDEPVIQTYPAWRRKILKLYPNATFEGDKDIAQATNEGKYVGQWDGAQGTYKPCEN